MTTIFALNHSSAMVCYHEWQWFSFLRFLNPQFVLLPVPQEEKILILSLFRHPRVSQTGCLAWITAQNWLLNFTGLDAAHCQDDAVAKHKPACLRSVHTSTQIDTLSTDYKHLDRPAEHWPKESLTAAYKAQLHITGQQQAVCKAPHASHALSLLI